jgi:hypothetical protein
MWRYLFRLILRPRELLDLALIALAITVMAKSVMVVVSIIRFPVLLMGVTLPGDYFSLGLKIALLSGLSRPLDLILLAVAVLFLAGALYTLATGHRKVLGSLAIALAVGMIAAGAWWVEGGYPWWKWDSVTAELPEGLGSVTMSARFWHAPTLIPVPGREHEERIIIRSPGRLRQQIKLFLPTRPEVYLFGDNHARLRIKTGWEDYWVDLKRRLPESVPSGMLVLSFYTDDEDRLRATNWYEIARGLMEDVPDSRTGKDERGSANGRQSR